MADLRLHTPRIDDDDGYGSPEATENWDDECNEYASFLEHKQSWAAVMQELGMFRRRSVVELEMLSGCNAQGEPLQRPRSTVRPTKLIDRRGKTLPRLNFR